MPSLSSIRIRLLAAPDAAVFKALRLVALRDTPSAFGSTPEYEDTLSLDAVVALMVPVDAGGGGTFGAFDGDSLVGLARLMRERGAKACHCAMLTSVYIASAYRGTGLAQRLLRETIDFGRGMRGLRKINLRVNAANVPAITLYRRLGFREYGREDEALCVDGVFHDELLMDMRLHE